MPESVTRFQSGSGTCTVPSALGGGLMSDIDKQFKSLISSTKKTVKGVKRKVSGTKRKTTKKKTTAKKKLVAKKKTSVKKKTPVKRKSTKKKTPVKRKSTKKKTPVKRKSTKKKTPVKRKPTKRKPIKKKATVKRKPTKRKPTKRKTHKGGVTSRPNRYYSGGTNINSKAGEFKVGIDQLGGGSSDFVGTVSSRGPVNYTNSEGSGMTGEQLFRTFNKTGTYMPHSTVNYGSVLVDGILGHKLTGGKRIR